MIAAVAALAEALRGASLGSHTHPSELEMITTAPSPIPMDSQSFAHTAGVSVLSDLVRPTGREVLQAHSNRAASANLSTRVIVWTPPSGKRAGEHRARDLSIPRDHERRL